MSVHPFKRAFLLAAVVSTTSANFASGQYYDPCNICAQPVAQTCYQTVPVTEYQPEVRKVMKAVPEIKYVEQPVTEYVPVTVQKTANVQTVNYQTVTECQQVTRDMGGWMTAHQPVPKMAPCDYDKRPTFGGWLNRTAYGIRSAFTPNYRTTRYYQPNVVTQNVPVNRVVAVPSTRQVTYNVTEYQKRETTRRVAVQTTKYVEAEETVMTPRTVYRTVPTGTAITYGYAPYGVPTSRTVLAPTPDPLSSTRSADAYKRSTGTREADNQDKNNPIKRSSLETPKAADDPFFDPSGARTQPQSETSVTTAAAKVPSAVRVSRGWRPTGSSNVAQSGPQLVAPRVASR